MRGLFCRPAHSELLYAWFKNGRVVFRAMLRVFGDNLRRTPMPSLLLIVEQDCHFDAKRAVARTRRFMPAGTAESMPNGGHAMVSDQIGAVGSGLKAVLDGEAG